MPYPGHRSAGAPASKMRPEILPEFAIQKTPKLLPKDPPKRPRNRPPTFAKKIKKTSEKRLQVQSRLPNDFLADCLSIVVYVWEARTLFFASRRVGCSMSLKFCFSASGSVLVPFLAPKTSLFAFLFAPGAPETQKKHLRNRNIF